MLIPVLLFLLGFLLLIKGGDWFVDGAVDIAHQLHLPEFLIGATVVSIGTTLPEVMVSAQAAIARNSGISYGNAIGSVICNASLIAAITAAIRPGHTNRRNLVLPIISFFVAALFYGGIAYTTGTFMRWHGILLLAMFVLYLILSTAQMKRSPEPEAETAEGSSGEVAVWKAVILLVVGAVTIALGAHLLVDNGTKIANALGVPDSVVGLTMVALGTSLPELVTAVSALIKGHSSLSLGNVIGANLFNIVLVSGTAITISPFSIPAEKVLLGMNSSLVMDLPVMFAVMLLLCVPPLIKGRLSRWQGITLLLIYVGFTAFQFMF